jgi:predicted ester cyclase
MDSSKDRCAPWPACHVLGAPENLRRQAISEKNRAIVERLTRELFNEDGNLDVADELIAADFVDHNPAPGSVGDRDSFKQRAAGMRGFGIRTRSEEIIAERDLVCERWLCTFKHTSDLMGMKPTGKEVSLLGFAMYRLHDGKVVEFWGLSDEAGMMRQLGVPPAS